MPVDYPLNYEKGQQRKKLPSEVDLDQIRQEMLDFPTEQYHRGKC